jgi:hypothetical protein
MTEQVSKDEVKSALTDEIPKKGQVINTPPCTPQPSMKLMQGLMFHPDIAFYSILATAVVGVITEIGTNNSQYASLAAILTAAITSGIQKYEQISNVK